MSPSIPKVIRYVTREEFSLFNFATVNSVLFKIKIRCKTKKTVNYIIVTLIIS
jgi:hypothetical protein